jgi:hypothetical protein
LPSVSVGGSGENLQLPSGKRASAFWYFSSGIATFPPVADWHRRLRAALFSLFSFTAETMSLICNSVVLGIWVHNRHFL